MVRRVVFLRIKLLRLKSLCAELLEAICEFVGDWIRGWRVCRRCVPMSVSASRIEWSLRKTSDRRRRGGIRGAMGLSIGRRGWGRRRRRRRLVVLINVAGTPWTPAIESRWRVLMNSSR